MSDHTITLIDTHTHIDDKKFANERKDLIARSKDAGLETFISIGCWGSGDDTTSGNMDNGGFGSLFKLSKEIGDVFAAIGVHPHDAEEAHKDGNALENIKKHAIEFKLENNKELKIVAIGETGLDYHYDNSPREIQQELFRSHIRLAKELKLPLVVHTRDAEDDTLRILKEENASETGGVIHCFTGSDFLAQACLELGFYISFSGVITFPKSDELREVLKRVPIEKTLVETDCPYLAPVPHRGKTNEPAFVVDTAKKVAEVKGLSFEDVARITTFNAKSLFGLSKEKEEELKLVYPIRDSLYLNITNRCTIYCSFCSKFTSYNVKGHNLKLKGEPTFDDMVDAIGDDYKKYNELVFCGYGEPLIRLELVKELGDYYKDKGCKIRINSDGTANMFHKRDITGELDFVDSISVSLNGFDNESYNHWIKASFGEDTFEGVKDFILKVKSVVPHVTATVVELPGLDVEKCRKVAEVELGVNFRSRPYNDMG